MSRQPLGIDVVVTQHNGSVDTSPNQRMSSLPPNVYHTRLNESYSSSEEDPGGFSDDTSLLHHYEDDYRLHRTARRPMEEEEDALDVCSELNLQLQRQTMRADNLQAENNRLTNQLADLMPLKTQWDELVATLRNEFERVTRPGALHENEFHDLRHRNRQLEDDMAGVRALGTEHQKENARLRDKVRQLDSELASLGADKATLSALLEELRAHSQLPMLPLSPPQAVESLRIQLNDASRRADEEKRKGEDWKQKAERSCEQIEELIQRQDELERMIEDARRTHEEFRSKAAQETSTKERDLSALRTELTRARADLEKTQADLRKKEEELEGTQSELKYACDELDETKVLLEDARKELEQSRPKLRELAELLTVRDELSKRQRDLQSQIEINESLVRRIAALDGEKQRLEGQVQTAEETVRELQSQVREHERKGRDSESKLKDCEARLRDVEFKLRESEDKFREGEAKVREAEEEKRLSENQLREVERRLRELQASSDKRLREVLVESEKKLREEVSQLENKGREEDKLWQERLREAEKDAQSRLHERQREWQELLHKEEKEQEERFVKEKRVWSDKFAEMEASWKAKLSELELSSQTRLRDLEAQVRDGRDALDREKREALGKIGDRDAVLASLKGQFDGLSQRLHEQERVLSQSETQCRELVARVKESDTKAEKSQVDVEKLRSELLEAKKQADAQAIRGEDLSARLEAEANRSKLHVGHLRVAEDFSKSLQDRLNSSSERIAQMEKELSGYKKQKGDTERSMQEAQAEVRMLREQLADAESKQIDIGKKMQAAKLERDGLERQVEAEKRGRQEDITALKSELSEAAARVASLKKDVENSRIEMESVKSNSVKLLGEIASRDEVIKARDAEIGGLCSQLDQVKKKAKELLAEQDSLVEKLEGAKKTIGDDQKDAANLRRELLEAKEQKEKLARDVAHSESVKKDLEETRKELSITRDSLRKLEMRAAKAEEIGVERATALDESNRNLHALREAMRLLESDHPRNSEALPSDSGRVPMEVQRELDQKTLKLSDVAQQLEAARQSLQRSQDEASRARLEYSTLQGQFTQLQTQLTASQDLISHLRRDLERQVSKGELAEKSLQEARIRIATMEGKVELVNKQLEEKDREIKRARDETEVGIRRIREDCEAEVKRHNASTVDALRRLEDSSRRAESAEGRMMELKSKHEEAANAARISKDALDGKVKELEHVLSLRREESLGTERLRQECDALRSNMAQKETSLRLVQSELDDSRADCKSARQAFDREQARAAQLEARVKDLAAEATSRSNTRISELETCVRDSASELAKLQSAYDKISESQRRSRHMAWRLLSNLAIATSEEEVASTRANTLQAEADVVKVELAHKAKMAKDLQHALQLAQEERSTVVARSAELEKHLESAQKDLRETRDANEMLNQAESMASREYGELRSQLNLAETRVQEYSRRLEEFENIVQEQEIQWARNQAELMARLQDAESRLQRRYEENQAVSEVLGRSDKERRQLEVKYTQLQSDYGRTTAQVDKLEADVEKASAEMANLMEEHKRALEDRGALVAESQRQKVKCSDMREDCEKLREENEKVSAQLRACLAEREEAIARQRGELGKAAMEKEQAIEDRKRKEAELMATVQELATSKRLSVQLSEQLAISRVEAERVLLASQDKQSAELIVRQSIEEYKRQLEDAVEFKTKYSILLEQHKALEGRYEALLEQQEALTERMPSLESEMGSRSSA
mmetsp:Transcript_7548/g.12596  ORF Transcript_7548/g.12596 Transcript_7548/m.12596 type:complete len:1729 (-) Transcript_7548:144-5330(-)